MSRDLEELDRGAQFTASEEEVVDAIEEVAEEFDKDFEEVRDNVAYIMDSSFDDGPSTSFNESVSGAALDVDETGTGDPRLEALEIYRLRQRV